MYLPRVSVDLYFSSRLSFLSVMKSRDAWILLSQTDGSLLYLQLEYLHQFRHKEWS